MNDGSTRGIQIHPGIFQLRIAYTNCYLLKTRWFIISIPADVAAAAERPDVLGTAAISRQSSPPHFDHVGMARRCEVQGYHCRPSDDRLARRPFSYAHEAPRLSFQVKHPRGLPKLGRMVGAGALWTRGVEARPDLVSGELVDVPGRPTPILSPGHTDGHVGFILPDSGTLFTGDALVTLDPYTGPRGPHIFAPAATNNTERALASLDAFSALDTDLVLTGHGEPWRRGIGEAVEQARTAPHY